MEILIIGDSIGVSLSWGFSKEIRTQYHLSIENRSVISSSLVVQSFYHWPKNINLHLSKKKYDLVIVFIGANDAQSFSYEKKKFVFGQTNWQTEYSRRVEEIVNLCKHRESQVYWIGLPPMEKEKYNGFMKLINSVVYQTMVKTNTFQYIDTSNILGNEKGEYSLYLNYKGKKTMMRGDGIHLTTAATHLLAENLIKKIYTDFSFIE